MWMSVVDGVDLVIVTMVAGRDRVQVDAGGRDRGFRLDAVALRVIPGQIAPGLHRQPGAAGGLSRYACTHRV